MASPSLPKTDGGTGPKMCIGPSGIARYARLASPALVVTVGGVLSNWWCSLVGRRCSERWGSVHPTTEQECLAFGLYIVAVRLSCTSEARATQWRILVQVAELVWAEIPGARAGIFKSPALLRNKAGEIQTARLQTHFLTLQITKHWLSCRNLRLRGGEALQICKYTYKSNEKVSFA